MQHDSAAPESPMLPYALAYALRGWPVFPVKGKVPDGRLVSHGLLDASTDAEMIRHWWSVAPDDGIGIRTGDGLLVVDVDVAHDGDSTLEEVEKVHGEFPETVEVLTGGGGMHLYFRVDCETRNTAGAIGRGVDTRGDGGYVVAPPSPHPSGRRYEFRSGHSPKDVEPAAAPSWLLGILIRPHGNGTKNGSAPEVGGVIAPGERNATLASLAGTMRRRGMAEPEILAALRETNARRCSPPLDDQEVAAIASSVGRYAPAEQKPANPHGERPLPRMVVQWAIDVRPEPVSWLWRPRIALGTLSLLAGVPGLGKSLLSCYLAACVTRGTLNGETIAAAPALICTAEDSFAHVVVPRLVAAGADMSRVGLVAMERDGVNGTPVLPDDVSALGIAISEHGVRLLVIDPLMAHLNPDTDSHRDQSVRTALAPLHQIAEVYQCAILLVSHLNKRPDTDLFSRVGGSIGLSGAARNVLLMTPDPDADEDDAARVLVHGKGNLGQLAPTLRMRVRGSDAVAADDGTPIATAVIELGENAPHLHAADVLRPKADADERKTFNDACALLREELARGPRAVREIQKVARTLDISDRTLRRARSSLGVTAKKYEFSAGWMWEPPPKWPDSSGHGQMGGQTDVANRPALGPSGQEGRVRTGLATGQMGDVANAAASAWPDGSEVKSKDLESGIHRCAAGCGREIGSSGVTCLECREKS